MTPVDVERLKNAIGDMVVYDTVASRTAYLPSVLARVDILAVRAEKAEAEVERLKAFISDLTTMPCRCIIMFKGKENQFTHKCTPCRARAALARAEEETK